MRRSRARYPLLAALALYGGPALAQGSQSEPAATAPGWVATLGFSVEAATGGGQSILPSTIDVRREGEPAGFGAPDDASGFAILESGPVTFGPAVDFRYADGRFALDGGVYAEYWAIGDRLRLRIEALHDLGGGGGGHVTFGGDAVIPVRSMTASIGPRLTLGDRDYFRTTADTSERSPARDRFYAGATAALKVPVSDALAVTAYDEVQVPLSGSGERDGAVQNTVGLEFDVSFRLPGWR